MIHFPLWVGAPTPCKTRSQKLVLPGEHGADIRVGVFHNVPVVTARNPLGKLYSKWENDAAAYQLISLNKVR